MKRIKNVQHALKIFEEVVIKRAKALDEGKGKTANIYFNKKVQIVTYLKEQHSIPELKILLQHSHPQVRLSVATYLLPFDEKLALKILQEVANITNGGEASFCAEMTIQEWKNGNIKTYIQSLVL